MTLNTATSRKEKVTLGVLAKEFPLAFGKGARPLKIGVHLDVHAALGDRASLARIRNLIGRYTQRWAYLELVCQGGTRVDLQGQPAGLITEEDQKLARRNLNALESKRPLAKAARSKMLKEFEASGMRVPAFAEQKGITMAEANSQLDRAKHERSVRRAKRLEVAKAFGESGLSIEAFAVQLGWNPLSVQRAIEKAASYAAAPPLAPSTSK